MDLSVKNDVYKFLKNAVKNDKSLHIEVDNGL
jgi:hypothetical protein